MIEISVFNSLSNHQHQWDVHPNPVLFETSKFLEVTRTTNTQIEHRYALVKKNGKVIGRVYGQIVPFEGNQLKNFVPDKKDLATRTINSMVNCALEKVKWKILVIGNIYITGDCGQCWERDINPYEKAQILLAVIKKMQDEAKDISVALISDIYTHQLNMTPLLKQSGFRKFEVEPDMVFYNNPDWKSFDDYLQSVSSKYRVRAKKVFKVSSELILKRLSLQEVEDRKKEIFALYQNVMHKIDFKLAEVTEDYFVKMKAAFPEEFQITSFSFRGKMVGFISYFNEVNKLDIHLIGLDYSVNEKLRVYQRILYECIKAGIERNKSTIQFGRTASAIKSTIGAKPKKVYAFLKHNKQLSNMVVKPFTKYLKPVPFIERNPFKDGLN